MTGVTYNVPDEMVTEIYSEALSKIGIVSAHPNIEEIDTVSDLTDEESGVIERLAEYIKNAFLDIRSRGQSIVGNKLKEFDSLFSELKAKAAGKAINFDRISDRLMCFVQEFQKEIVTNSIGLFPDTIDFHDKQLKMKSIVLSIEISTNVKLEVSIAKLFDFAVNGKYSVQLKYEDT